MTNRPGFFKFYIPEVNSQSLKIPPRFVRLIQGTVPENVAFRDQYNNLWQVKLLEIGNSQYFADGWQEFVNDNMIKGGDLLVFTYSSEGLFDFKIFGSSACEEKGVGGLIYRKAKEQDNTRSLENVNEVDDSDDNDHEPTTQEEYKQDDSPRGSENMDFGSSANARGSNRNWDWYGEKIFKSGHIRPPVNPYFVAKTRRNRAFELYIPADVVKCHELQLPETIMLVDPDGRKFQSKRKIWKDGRVILKGGWKTLCAVNMVGKEDHCICEFIQPQAKEKERSVVQNYMIFVKLFMHTLNQEIVLTNFIVKRRIFINFYKMTTTEMRVHMDCAGCESRIKKALLRVKGVNEVDIDMGLQKVTVTGWADPKKVLKTVRKTGRRAELWQFPYNPAMRNHNFTGDHHHNYGGPSTYYTAQPSGSSYNYYKHGCDSHGGSQPYYSGNSSIFGNRAGDTFSDENPHGCSIM